jgi:hypothetical protein
MDNLENLATLTPVEPIVVTCDCCVDTGQDVTFAQCQEFQESTIYVSGLKCEGRLLKIKVNLSGVCRGRNVTVGVLVCENDPATQSVIWRGFKACEITVPIAGGTANTCVDNVEIDRFCFVFPEDNLCETRTFKVRVIAHYSSFQSNCPF